MLVRGGGVAAHCVAHLLSRAGVPVTLDDPGRARVPAIMIGDATQALITDVFARTALWDGLHRIERRIVAWGHSAAPKTLPHSAIVISEEQLTTRLRPNIPAGVHSFAPQWTIHASPPLPPEVAERDFGSRHAQAVAVQLNNHMDPANCWIESLENGWLFLIPNATNQGWLLAVGHEPESLLAASRIIAPEIASVTSTAGLFPAHPRMADPICAPGWLACGTAAMAFDPICGDGTGNAVREAILAQAVIRAHNDLGDGVLDHYRIRLLLGFLRHLEQCRQFYSTGHSTDWWRGQLAQVLDGIAWCRCQLGSAPPVVQYRLSGFDLQPANPPVIHPLPVDAIAVKE